MMIASTVWTVALTTPFSPMTSLAPTCSSPPTSHSIWIESATSNFPSSRAWSPTTVSRLMGVAGLPSSCARGAPGFSEPLLPPNITRLLTRGGRSVGPSSYAKGDRPSSGRIFFVVGSASDDPLLAEGREVFAAQAEPAAVDLLVVGAGCHGPRGLDPARRRGELRHDADHREDAAERVGKLHDVLAGPYVWIREEILDAVDRAARDLGRVEPGEDLPRVGLAHPVLDERVQLVAPPDPLF